VTERSKNDPLGKPGTECYQVAGKGGTFSGNDTCPMRYDLTNFYEDPKGICTAKHDGATVTLSFFGTDPPGMGKLCTSNKGTGVNDTSKPPNKAGDAHPRQLRQPVCLKNGRTTNEEGTRCGRCALLAIATWGVWSFIRASGTGPGRQCAAA